MFVNLSAVMLRFVEPFLDVNLTKRDKIDPNYVFYSTRLDLRVLTALHASSEVVAEWLKKTDTRISDDRGNCLPRSQEATTPLHINEPMSSCSGKSKYTFICECFFMTARVLNLGFLKAFSNFKHLVQDISRCEDSLSTYKAMQGQAPSPQLDQDVARLEKELESYSQEKFCYEAQILRDGNLIQHARSFYPLMVVWLVDVGGGFEMPLPSTCPMEFACMPKHFVEDAMEMLIFASRIPRALGCTGSSGSTAAATLFEGHQLYLEHLVRNLLKLYVDIEFTGSNTQISSTFTIRSQSFLSTFGKFLVIATHGDGFMISSTFTIRSQGFWSTFGKFLVIATHGDG